MFWALGYAFSMGDGNFLMGHQDFFVHITNQETFIKWFSQVRNTHLIDN